MRGNKSLSEFYCKSVDDLPSMSSSLNSSSGEDETSIESDTTKSKMTHEERRKILLDRMLKEKSRIEAALEQKVNMLSHI